MSAERKWTKRRVLRAFSEWKELNDHAEEVFEVWRRFTRETDATFEEIRLPGWIGTGWPGSEFEVQTYADYDDGTRTNLERLPFEYLWTEKWKATLETKWNEAQASAAGQAKERAERAELARLRAKYEAPQ